MNVNTHAMSRAAILIANNVKKDAASLGLVPVIFKRRAIKLDTLFMTISRRKPCLEKSLL